MFPSTKTLLILILLTAAVMRFQGIFWGIPVFDPLVHNFHPDEPKIIKGAYSFPRDILKNTDFRYPTFYHYFLGTLSIPAKLLFKMNGWPFESYKVYMAVFGRVVSVLLGVGSVFLTFLLGRRLYNEQVGLIAALFLSFCLYHVQNSSWATLDVPNGFFLVLTLYLAFRMHEDPVLKWYLLTGISLGVLIGTKYFGGMILISIVILHFHRLLKGRKVSGSEIIHAALSKNIWILGLTAVIVFFMTTPGILLKPISFYRSQSYEITLASGMRYQLIIGFSLIVSFLRNFIRATGPFLSLVMFLGLIVPFRKRWDGEIPILALLIPFFITFGALTSRHLIAVLPLTSLLAAHGAWYLYENERFLSKRVWLTVLSIWIVFALVYNWTGILERKNDTRVDSAHYIDGHIPEGSAIGAASIGDYPRWPWMLPYIDEKKYKIVDPLEQPEYVILSGKDFIDMERALSSDKLQDYKWDPRYAREWYKSHPPSEEVFRFYDDVLNEKGGKYRYRLVKTFVKEGWVPIEFSAPEIRIYEKAEE